MLCSLQAFILRPFHFFKFSTNFPQGGSNLSQVFVFVFLSKISETARTNSSLVCRLLWIFPLIFGGCYRQTHTLANRCSFQGDFPPSSSTSSSPRDNNKQPASYHTFAKWKTFVLFYFSSQKSSERQNDKQIVWQVQIKRSCSCCVLSPFETLLSTSRRRDWLWAAKWNEREGNS